MFTESFFCLLEPHYDHYNANANHYNNMPRIISNRLLSGQPLARAAAQALGATASIRPPRDAFLCANLKSLWYLLPRASDDLFSTSTDNPRAWAGNTGSARLRPNATTSHRMRRVP